MPSNFLSRLPFRTVLGMGNYTRTRIIVGVFLLSKVVLELNQNYRISYCGLHCRPSERGETLREDVHFLDPVTMSVTVIDLVVLPSFVPSVCYGGCRGAPGLRGSVRRKTVPGYSNSM